MSEKFRRREGCWKSGDGLLLISGVQYNMKQVRRGNDDRGEARFAPVVIESTRKTDAVKRMLAESGAEESFGHHARRTR